VKVPRGPAAVIEEFTYNATGKLGRCKRDDDSKARRPACIVDAGTLRSIEEVPRQIVPKKGITMPLSTR